MHILARYRNLKKLIIKIYLPTTYQQNRHETRASSSVFQNDHSI